MELLAVHVGRPKRTVPALRTNERAAPKRNKRWPSARSSTSSTRTRTSTCRDADDGPGRRHRHRRRQPARGQPGREIIDVDAPTPPSPRGQKRKKDDKAAPAMRSGRAPRPLNDVDQTFALNGEQATSAVRSVIDASADAINSFRASRSSKLRRLGAARRRAASFKNWPVRPEVDATYANKLPARARRDERRARFLFRVVVRAPPTRGSRG